MSDINYELYKVFYYVAKNLSFSGAAKELFISQSAVSQSVKILEKKLNHSLFMRNTKKVTLTKEGEILLKHIEPAIHLIIRGENRVLDSSETGGGQIRIGASDTICRYYLVPYLKSFHREYPDVHIKVTNGTSAQCVRLLEKNQVDLVVVNQPNSKLENISNIKPLRSFRDVFIANPLSFPVKNRTFSLFELQKYPILMLEKQSATSGFLYQLFLDHRLELIPSVELSSNDLLIDLAKIGLGIAFVPEFCITGSEKELAVLQIRETIPMRKLAAAYKEEVPLSAAAIHFIESLS